MLGRWGPSLSALHRLAATPSFLHPNARLLLMNPARDSGDGA
jgi:hypothetical protein